MGKMSKDKGKQGERDVAALLRKHGFTQARRGQQYCGLEGDADVVGLDGYHIEVKRTERLNLYEALEQSKRDAKDGEIPLVFHRRNRERWVVILDAEEFLEVLENDNVVGVGQEHPAGD